MKVKVITTPKPAVKTLVYLDDLTGKEIIGVKSHGGTKGFLTRSEFEGGHFILLARDAVTVGNCWGTTVNEKNSDLVNFSQIIDIIRDNDLDVYVFSNTMELFDWLAKD